MKHRFLFNVLHYADYEGIDVLTNLCLATHYGGPNMEALQLDMIWPAREVLWQYRQHFPHIKIILQINAQALDRVGNDPANLVKELCKYEHAIDFVLLDKSMGKGVGMDAEVLLPFVRMIKLELPLLGIAVAGGLGPTTYKLADPILKEFPCVSLDAQSKLRPSGSALDPLDWIMAEIYFKQSLEMMRQCKSMEYLM